MSEPQILQQILKAIKSENVCLKPISSSKWVNKQLGIEIDRMVLEIDGKWYCKYKGWVQYVEEVDPYDHLKISIVLNNIRQNQILILECSNS